MKPIGALLILFLVIGLFAHKYHAWTRLLLIVGIAAVVLYETFH